MVVSSVTTDTGKVYFLTICSLLKQLVRNLSSIKISDNFGDHSTVNVVANRNAFVAGNDVTEVIMDHAELDVCSNLVDYCKTVDAP